MAMFAMALPIVPGKTEQWSALIAELNGPRSADYRASRNSLGVRERTFLQHTPMGDFVVVTLEGDNPAAAFGAFGQGSDEFTAWFVAQVKEIHGVDLASPPPGPLPELVIDSAARSTEAIDLSARAHASAARPAH
ncbi:MAG: hypothetical protein WCP28_04155 [Actinomycetes bacterium]